MSEWIEISAKTVDEAIDEAIIKLHTVRDNMEIDVIEKESSGFLGFIGKRNATIRAKIKEDKKDINFEKPEKVKNESVNIYGKFDEDRYDESDKYYEKEINRKPVSEKRQEEAKAYSIKFLSDLFNTMNIKAEINSSFDYETNEMLVDFKTEDLGILIGKRGQTLDSLQYILGLAVNKNTDEYVRVRLDSENYRERRKETLENLAKNIASKVKRTGRTVVLEPMNSFERRIIHSVLQGDPECETLSEGDDPYRKVVVRLKGYNRYREYNNRKSYYKKPYGRSYRG